MEESVTMRGKGTVETRQNKIKILYIVIVMTKCYSGVTVELSLSND